MYGIQKKYIYICNIAVIFVYRSVRVSYADDLTLIPTNNNIQESGDNLNDYLATLNEWLISKKVIQSPEKSTATLFTTWNREINTHFGHPYSGQSDPHHQQTQDFWFSV